MVKLSKAEEFTGEMHCEETIREDEQRCFYTHNNRDLYELCRIG